MAKEINRCSWPGNDELMIEYHDKEWGSPCHDDRTHFEYLLLDTFQAGLSWRTILHKRKNFRRAFSNFNPKVIAKYDDGKIKSLMNDSGIIRNRLKVEGAVKNAKAFLNIQKDFGSFDKYIWQFTPYEAARARSVPLLRTGFTGHKTIDGKQKISSAMRSKSKESDAMSRDLKKRGFVFVGSTICYAYMQGAGLVNDHLVGCFRYREINQSGKNSERKQR
ncbi:MAG: DNA-3-methyladenine glycosylase I [Parcubacteria group bacterium]|nr:DNA-3-methyladenine glycosylase I [Parcubacteria group bacterium]